MKNTPQLGKCISRVGLATASIMLALAAVLVWAVITTQSAEAQIFTSLHSFGGTDGKYTTAGLAQAVNGNFYGITYEGGVNGDGTVFKITPGGTLTTLHSFDSTDGANPSAGLVLATNGDLYGTTYKGGANQYGTVFKITPSGTLTTLHSFDNTDGANPIGTLIQAADGNFYGITYQGGANSQGTVFKMTPSGTLTTIYSLCSIAGCMDGYAANAGLIQATDGNLYGTTNGGGINGGGTVFKITLGGTLTTLYNFCALSDCTDGYDPIGGVVQAANGNFYGTTFGGGVNSLGTVFKMSPGGTLTTLYNFCSTSGCTDGYSPYSELVQATNGNLYGTTYEGGASGNYGTVFEITPSGTLTTLHSFDGTDGANPIPGLVQATNGTFYGTTYEGGASDDGTVFSLSVKLGPFVKTLPTSGKVGAAVKILGNNLTGATGVTFNGTAATFSVVSKSEITTTVPTGATSGTVEVTIPTRTLKSNVAFRVTP